MRTGVSAPTRFLGARCSAGLLGLLALCGCAAAASAGTVTFQSQALGAEYGSTVGDVPGDLVFTEDGIDVSVQTFLSSGTPAFGFGRIQDSFGAPRFFYDQNILRFNNIGFVFDFGGAGDASFQYMNLGGGVNLGINGSAPVEASSFAALPGTIGGVTVSVTTVAVSGGVKGTVTLTGAVSSLRIGGQELFLDDVTGGGSGGPDPDPNDPPCDYTITHEGIADGTLFGDAAGQGAGDFMFSESGVPVYTDKFTLSGGSQTFGSAKVWDPGVAGFGNGLAMQYSNMNGFYSIIDLGVTVKRVRFEYLDMGGVENVEVNGDGLFVGQISNLPANIASGVTASVTTVAVGGGVRGVVTLTGDVQKLTLGGQEFFVDEFCIERGIDAPGHCGPTVDNQSEPLGSSWGGDNGNSPGDQIFMEDDIVVGIERFKLGSSILFGTASIDSPQCDQITSQAMSLKQISAVFDLTNVLPVTYARVDFCDCGEVENVWVNGTPWEGNLAQLPFDAFGPGIYTDVTVESNTGGCVGGVLEILGPLDEVIIGGEQLQLDDFCVVSEANSSVLEADTAAFVSVETYPNPFHATTTMRLQLEQEGPVELAIFDMSGRRVATLLDEVVAAGTHQVGWDGREEAGSRLANGIYFIRLVQGDSVSTRKVALAR